MHYEPTSHMRRDLARPAAPGMKTAKFMRLYHATSEDLAAGDVNLDVDGMYFRRRPEPFTRKPIKGTRVVEDWC